VNEHLKASPNAIRLLTDYEKGPDDGSVPLSGGGAALSPYVCPGGELTIGYGCTKWFDGDDVEMTHRLADEDEARRLLDYQLDVYEVAVRKAATREMSQDNFDAFVCLAFNIGVGAFSDSSAIKAFNDGFIENAAANFGMWTGSTCDRPPRKQRNAPEYQAKIAKDHKGNARWIGPDGQYCRYMLRYVGLLSRHYAEALLFMGRDHRRALRSEHGIELKLVPTDPADAQWNPKKGRWQDEVKSKTAFKDVYAFAYNDLLPKPELVLTIPASPPQAAEVAQRQPDPARSPAAGATIRPSASGSSEAVPVQPSIPAPQPTKAEPAPAPVKPPPLPKDAAPASIEPKDMVLSKRFWGLTVTAIGTTNFLPRGVSEWINNEGNRELLTWLVVVVIGFALYKYGQRKAKTGLK
jgi:lysozyme